MKVIMKVLSNTIEKFIWIFFLLLIFCYIYALLGMNLYGGHPVFNENGNRHNFNTFGNAFITVF